MFEGAAMVLDYGVEVILFEGYDIVVIDAAGRAGARRRRARKHRAPIGLHFLVMVRSNMWANQVKSLEAVYVGQKFALWPRYFVDAERF